MDQSERLLEREDIELGLLRVSGPDAMLSWGHVSCPMCGRPYSVHEKLGGCPYYNPELEEEEMRTEQYVEKKLEEWNEAERRLFLEAYGEGDWDTVYDMTEDLTGSAYIKQLTLAELVNALKGDLR